MKTPKNPNCFIEEKDRETLCPAFFFYFPHPAQGPFSCGLNEVQMENWTVWKSRIFANSLILILKFLQISPGLCLSTELIKSHLLTE